MTDKLWFRMKAMECWGLGRYPPSQLVRRSPPPEHEQLELFDE
jgi:hypothetical protein